MINEEDTSYPLEGSIEITLVRVVQPVRLTKADQSLENCQIREMDGSQRDLYLNKQRSKSKTENGKTTLVNYSGLFSDLLSFCLYHEEGGLFTEKEIQSFPVSAQEQLHKAALKINKMSKAGAAAAMNNIAVALETQADDKDILLSIIKDIVKNYEKQIPGTMKEDKDGNAVPEGEN